MCHADPVNGVGKHAWVAANGTRRRRCYHERNSGVQKRFQSTLALVLRVQVIQIPDQYRGNTALVSLMRAMKKSERQHSNSVITFM